MHYETKSILDKIKGSIILATEEANRNMQILMQFQRIYWMLK